ncbi:MAG: hypothetical protein ACC645_06950 [Pirellulales bacterium]
MRVRRSAAVFDCVEMVRFMVDSLLPSFGFRHSFVIGYFIISKRRGGMAIEGTLRTGSLLCKMRADHLQVCYLLDGRG